MCSNESEDSTEDSEDSNSSGSGTTDSQTTSGSSDSQTQTETSHTQQSGTSLMNQNRKPTGVNPFSGMSRYTSRIHATPFDAHF